MASDPTLSSSSLDLGVDAVSLTEDLVNIGAYVAGSNPRVDHALARIDQVRAFLRQGIHERSDFATFLPALRHNVELQLRYVECFAGYDDPYDVLLDDY